MSVVAQRAAVVIGCSTGGLKALSTVLSGLRADLQVPVIVLCHRGQDDDSGLLVELLARQSPLPVHEAEERQPVTPGIVHLAPSGYHLLIEADRRFMLSTDIRVRFVRPAVDVLFASAADVYAESLLAVVLTGANDDGADGLVQVRQRGGYALVQDPKEAEAPQMPLAALTRAGADEVLTLTAIARRINECCCPP
ncbi:chemotaxis protein CheB [uncultured Nevskia sp.]|uniref:chemotaxis protein CheB n=1 Tax=uncultured Nevskia sp. TaxID=228950 RepID=UPI0025F99E50|nr:chemotaxis protein CheB [uncultured Nevskia sp.]